jgi:RNA polymerase sigma-70 factor, ECF subfamily
MESEPVLHDRVAAMEPRFEDIVDRYYRSLFRFALSLTRSEADACDLTQHTFYTWGLKGNNLRDVTKVRAWLFTTLHRAFLERKRRETRFPHQELETMETELPSVPACQEARVDAAGVLEALAKVDQVFRAPVTLFYLEDCPYGEIALILNVPIGTVKSRIARGIVQLQKLLSVHPSEPNKPTQLRAA